MPNVALGLGSLGQGIQQGSDILMAQRNAAALQSQSRQDMLNKQKQDYDLQTGKEADARLQDFMTGPASKLTDAAATLAAYHAYFPKDDHPNLRMAIEAKAKVPAVPGVDAIPGVPVNVDSAQEGVNIGLRTPPPMLPPNVPNAPVNALPPVVLPPANLPPLPTAVHPDAQSPFAQGIAGMVPPLTNNAMVTPPTIPPPVGMVPPRAQAVPGIQTAPPTADQLAMTAQVLPPTITAANQPPALGTGPVPPPLITTVGAHDAIPGVPAPGNPFYQEPPGVAESRQSHQDTLDRLKSADLDRKENNIASRVAMAPTLGAVRAIIRNNPGTPWDKDSLMTEGKDSDPNPQRNRAPQDLINEQRVAESARKEFNADYAGKPLEQQMAAAKSIDDRLGLGNQTQDYVAGQGPKGVTLTPMGSAKLAGTQATTEHTQAETASLGQSDMGKAILAAGAQADPALRDAIIHDYNMTHPNARLDHNAKYGPTVTQAADMAYKFLAGTNIKSEIKDRIVREGIAQQNADAHTKEAGTSEARLKAQLDGTMPNAVDPFTKMYAASLIKQTPVLKQQIGDLKAEYDHVHGLDNSHQAKDKTDSNGHITAISTTHRAQVLDDLQKRIDAAQGTYDDNAAQLTAIYGERGLKPNGTHTTTPVPGAAPDGAQVMPIAGGGNPLPRNGRGQPTQRSQNPPKKYAPKVSDIMSRYRH